MSVPRILLSATLVTVVSVLALVGLGYVLAFTHSPDLGHRIDDAVEARQTWRIHHSVERKVFACLHCGHAVHPEGALVHHDAYSCMQCNQTSFTAECDLSLSEKEHSLLIYSLAEERSPHPWLTPALRFLLSLSFLSFHPSALVCVPLALAVLALWVREVLRRVRELDFLRSMRETERIRARVQEVERAQAARDPVSLGEPFFETPPSLLRQRHV